MNSLNPDQEVCFEVEASEPEEESPGSPWQDDEEHYDGGKDFQSAKSAKAKGTAKGGKLAKESTKAPGKGFKSISSKGQGGFKSISSKGGSHSKAIKGGGKGVKKKTVKSTPKPIAAPKSTPKLPAGPKSMPPPPKGPPPLYVAMRRQEVPQHVRAPPARKKPEQKKMPKSKSN